MSDVAHIRHQIDQEIAAMSQAKDGFAAGAQHDIITHRFDTLAGHVDHLKRLGGEEWAVQVLAECLEQGA